MAGEAITGVQLLKFDAPPQQKELSEEVAFATISPFKVARAPAIPEAVVVVTDGPAELVVKLLISPYE